LDRNEFIKEWDKIKDEIYNGIYLYPLDFYIRVVNNDKGYILAHEYEFAHEDFINFYILRDSKKIYVGGEHLSNIKEMSISW